MTFRFSPARVLAILAKEFVQMRRDRLTFGMIVGVPIMQLFLFGFAINNDPRHLPTAISISDPSPFSDAIVAGLANSDYFDVVKATNSPKEAHLLLDRGDVAFVVDIPVNFSRDLVRGANPELLVEADATDPAAGSYAIAALSELVSAALRDDLTGPLAARAAATPDERATRWPWASVAR